MWANSTIICKEIYEEPDLETEDNHITIIIHDASTTAGNDDASLGAPETHVTLSSVPSDDDVHIQSCLRECLKLACNQETEVCCFLCPKTYKSFADLRGHFIEAHNLTQSITKLSNIPSEYITEIAKEIKHLKCSCKAFVCKTCNENFSHLLQLMQHVILDHSTTYGSFPFFAGKKQRLQECQQCIILEKLCHIDYDVFVRVLLDFSECSDERCKMLMSWPLAECSEPCVWCAEEGEQEEIGLSELTGGSDAAEREVVCYRIKRAHMKCSQKAKEPMCICPILKCPDCPKTVANYADLCKHIRLNGHSSWQDMRVLWDKYKIIKENCPLCPKYSYHCYILCPHCPHVALESEKAAQAHMDSKHKAHTNKAAPVCICPNYYSCLKCSTSYPTPQSLHHHLQEMQHVTEENLAAIPAMIHRSFKGRKRCQRCSLLDFGNVPGLCQEECSCRWVQCTYCNTSFRKVSSLLDHIDKVKHPMSATDIRREKEKLASSVKTCQRCSRADRYCVLCHKKENFLHTHMRTQHQDHQIMLLNDSMTFLEEVYMAGWDKGRLARYECSVCLHRFSCINTLRHHVCLQHPHHYFTLFCLDLSNNILQVKDFAAHEELLVLNVVSKSS